MSTDDRETPIPGLKSDDSNGHDRELLEFVLDPEHPDLQVLCKVVQRTYKNSVDTKNEVADMRSLVIDVSASQRIIAMKLGIDLDAEKLRAQNEAKSLPPGQKEEPSIPPLRDIAKGLRDMRAKADSFHDVDEQMLKEQAEIKKRQEELDEEQAELKQKQERQDKIVQSSLVRGIPKLLKILGPGFLALGVIAAIAQQAWVQCSAGRGAPPGTAPAESTNPR